MKPHAVLILASTALVLGCVSAQQPKSLRELGMARGLTIGTAINPGVLFDSLEPDYARIAYREFATITPENAMKFSSLSGGRNQYNFAATDALVANATKNKQTVRGHTLIWHEQLPNWLLKELSSNPPTRTTMLPIFEEHIKSVAGHFAGKLTYWDVVNEAVNENGTMRQTPWASIGEDYIARAFVLARASDPKAKLCYNDFNTDGINAKSTGVYDMLKKLKAQHVPIDCVGFQAHLDSGFSASTARVKENLERFVALGLEVHFTEVDVQQKGPGDKAARLAAQARVYRELLSVCLSVKGCTQFVMWGFTDAYSWRASNEPLIFDSAYQPKPAYFALLEAMKP